MIWIFHKLKKKHKTLCFFDRCWMQMEETNLIAQKYWWIAEIFHCVPMATENEVAVPILQFPWEPLYKLTLPNFVLFKTMSADNTTIPWMCIRVAKLTVGAGSLQVRYDSENVVHQVRSLFVLQYAARGGVGGVYIGQIRQVHPWKKQQQKTADRKRWVQEKHTALFPHALKLFEVLHWTPVGNMKIFLPAH